MMIKTKQQIIYVCDNCGAEAKATENYNDEATLPVGWSKQSNLLCPKCSELLQLEIAKKSLLPCPFCEGKARIVFPDYCYVQCDICGARSVGHFPYNCYTEEKLSNAECISRSVKDWNKRPDKCTHCTQSC